MWLHNGFVPVNYGQDPPHSSQKGMNVKGVDLSKVTNKLWVEEGWERKKDKGLTEDKVAFCV